MDQFTLHEPKTASAEGRHALARAETNFGFLPNLIRVMAETPPLAEAYLTLTELFERTALTPEEQQVVLLTVSRRNGCDYCVAAHSVTAEMQRLPEDVIQALRQGRQLTDTRLEALRRFSEHLVEDRGWADESELASFMDAGFNREQILAVVLGIGLKTLSNYTNHLAATPLDDVITHRAWFREESAA